MKQPSFELTPAQKGLLASLLDETGQPAPTLAAAIGAALKELEERQRYDPAHGDTSPQETVKPLWERICETFSDLSEEDLASLPTDGAAQVDHYVYGWPKR